MDFSDEAVYEGRTFNGIELEKVTLKKVEFLGCSFKRCSFNETAFEACEFRDSSFVNCSLDICHVDRTRFKSTLFEKTKLMGINWTAASWGRKAIAQLIKTVDFDGCVLNYSSFMGLDLTNIRIVNSVVHEVDFSEAVLHKADFSGSDLQRSIFRNTDLREANFSSARNYSISPILNKIKGAKFSLPEAMSLLYNMDIDLDTLSGEEAN
jgi:uncharacterized protein YjbI with pentapeptide repeats